MSDFKLYEINELLEQAICEVNKIAEENEGEIPEGWALFLDDVQMERDKKLLDVARYLKSINAKADAIKNEETTLRERRKALESSSDRLKRYVENNMTHDEKLEDSNTVLSYRKSKRVIIDNEKEIPEGYFIFERKIQLMPIKKDIESGKEVAGTHIEQFFNLQIK